MLMDSEIVHDDLELTLKNLEEFVWRWKNHKKPKLLY